MKKHFIVYGEFANGKLQMFENYAADKKEAEANIKRVWGDMWGGIVDCRAFDYNLQFKH